MSDEPRAGEWATVVKQHCEARRALGAVVKVEAIAPAHPAFHLICLGCGARHAWDEPHALLAGLQTFYPLRWLKRLPPPEDVARHDAIPVTTKRPRRVLA